MKQNITIALSVKIKYLIIQKPTVFIIIRHRPYSYKNDWDFNSNWKMYFYVTQPVSYFKIQVLAKVFLMAILHVLGLFDHLCRNYSCVSKNK